MALEKRIIKCNCEDDIPPLEEQMAIAKVLVSADNEIKQHNIKLNQLRKQKQGLMQQLLTGKKRVKI
jgi:type I restriction enzyme S subunit